MQLGDELPVKFYGIKDDSKKKPELGIILKDQNQVVFMSLRCVHQSVQISDKVYSADQECPPSLIKLIWYRYHVGIWDSCHADHSKKSRIILIFKIWPLHFNLAGCISNPQSVPCQAGEARLRCPPTAHPLPLQLDLSSFCLLCQLLMVVCWRPR